MLSRILQTDYEELFDMRFNSILYAGLKLNDRGDMAERIPAKDMHTLTESDLVTPDFSRVVKLGDLDRMGLKNLNDIKVKHAVMSNGNLRLTLEPKSLGKTLCSSEMTTTLRELCTPFRVDKKAKWTPPNGTWTDTGHCYRQGATMFSNPVQGATSNSWLISALMSVAWSDPSVIKHCTRRAHSPSASCGSEGHKHEDCSLSIKLHSKGGDNDAPTSTVTVNCELPTNNSSSLLMYCRPSSMNYYSSHSSYLTTWGGEVWPALYEKAFAKWLTASHHDDDLSSTASSSTHRGAAAGFFYSTHAYTPPASTTTITTTSTSSEDHPDLTQTAHGDPVKAMAQLTDKEPQYFSTSTRHGSDLLSLVRTHCVNQRTIYPMVCWTRPSSDKFRGSTLVGNLAYSVLGWAAPRERKQYIILRHPWGATEPEGMTSYPGVVGNVDGKFWGPVGMVDRAAVFAIETGAFKEYFAGMGVAK